MLLLLNEIYIFGNASIRNLFMRNSKGPENTVTSHPYSHWTINVQYIVNKFQKKTTVRAHLQTFKVYHLKHSLDL